MQNAPQVFKKVRQITRGHFFRGSGVQAKVAAPHLERPFLCWNLLWTNYLFRKRRAMPSAPRAVPSNITVAPPSGTLLGVGPKSAQLEGP